MRTEPTEPALHRDYLTNLQKRHSIGALICSVETLALSFYGIIAGVIRTVEVMGQSGFFSFAFYTMASNMFAAMSVAFAIPFAVEGIRRRRFVLPRWVAVLRYLSTVSIAIMMVFVLAFMSWASPENAFGGVNFIMHVICPTLILISFFLVENGITYSMRHRLLGCIPFFVYLIVYFTEVVLIGEENGGWPDLYQIQDYLSPAVAVPLLLALGFGVSSLVAIVSNRLTKRRIAVMFAYWKEDTDPLEIRIEAYGIGSMMGRNSEENNILIPLDILSYFAKRYHLNTYDLIKAYIARLLNERRHRGYDS